MHLFIFPVMTPMRIKFAVIIFTTFFTTCTFAQSYFSKSFGSAGMACTGKGVAQAIDNALYYIGNYVNLQTSEHGMELYKLDAAGNIIWRNFIGSQTAHANRIIYTAQNKLAIIGQVDDSAGNADAMVLLADTTGQIIFNKTFGQLASTEMFSGIAPDKDGGFVLSGFTSNPTGPGNAVYLLRIDSVGNEIWSKIYSYNVNAVGDDISATSDGNFVFGGDKKTASIDYNAQVIKIDTSGTIIWNTDITYAFNSGCKNILETVNGNYLLVGEAATATSAYFDPFITLLDTAGNILWSHIVPCGNGPEAGYDVIEYLPQQYIITGFGLNQSTGNTDLMIIYLDSNGNETNKQYFGNSGYDQAFNLILDNSSNSFYAAGMTLVNGEGKYFLIHQPVLTTSSVVQFEKPDITIFPNPTSHILNISKRGTFKIVNHLGQCLIDTPLQQIDVSSLPNGCYIIVATIGNQVIRQKFFKI